MLKYFCLVVFAVVGFAAPPNEDDVQVLKKIGKQLHLECQILTGAKDEQIEKFRSGDFTESSELKHYIVCTYLHSGVLNNSLDVDYGLLLSMQPPNKPGLADLYSNCIEEAKKAQTEDVVELTWQALKCSYNGNPKNFVLV